MDAVFQAIEMGKRTYSLQKRGNFLWPYKMELELDRVPVRIPRDGVAETSRDVEHIAPEEIQRAMLFVIEHALGIKTDSLFIEVARIFGFDRTGDKIREHFTKALKGLLKTNRIVENGDLLTLQ